MNETTQPAVAGPVEPTVRPVAWRSVGGSIWGHKTSEDDEPLYGAELKRERDMLMETLRDEMDENLRLRELGGAGPDENITAMTERLIRELKAHRLYARALCKAVDAATDFAGTVAGGASWWDDVWADHAAALDRARERITLAQGPNVRAEPPP